MELEEQMAETVEAVMAILTTYGLSVVGAVVILIVGWIVSGWVARSIRKAATKSETIDVTLASFFASMAKYGILTFTLIAVLSRFGVETTSFVALLGALGLAIGLSLQGTLANVASGVMLIIFRPFKVGDFVDTAGVSGTVKDITLFTTEMATGDNVKVIVPNGAVWGGMIKNFSGNATRRVDMVMGIGYGSNIDHAIKTMTDIVNADNRVHGDPEPFFAVGELADSSVNIIVRVWTNAPDYWGVKFDLTKSFKEAFDREGIDIPFPQTVVHHVNEQG